MNPLAIVQAVLAALCGHSVTVSFAVAPVENKLIVEDAGTVAPVVPVKFTEDQAKAKLTELLSNQKYKFRSIDKLSTAIGASKFETEELLASIGARPSRRNASLFGLVSRIGSRQYA